MDSTASNRLSNCCKDFIVEILSPLMGSGDRGDFRWLDDATLFSDDDSFITAALSFVVSSFAFVCDLEEESFSGRLVELKEEATAAGLVRFDNDFMASDDMDGNKCYERIIKLKFDIDFSIYLSQPGSLPGSRGTFLQCGRFNSGIVCVGDPDIFDSKNWKI